MKTLTINPPRQHGQPINSAPLIAHLSAINVATVTGLKMPMTCVDVAFTPEHANTIYVFACDEQDGKHYIWADDLGNAGRAVTDEVTA
jgi:hypothetical protein